MAARVAGQPQVQATISGNSPGTSKMFFDVVGAMAWIVATGQKDNIYDIVLFPAVLGLHT